MIGAATLVPPNTKNVPLVPNVSATATPVFGSATAETSVSARREQLVGTLLWKAGRDSKDEQPDPAPLQAVSLQPRLLLARVSDVPPTAVTNCEAAGYSTPKPLSPELAVTATPECS